MNDAFIGCLLATPMSASRTGAGVGRVMLPAAFVATRRHSLAQKGSVNLEINSALIGAHILAWTAGSRERTNVSLSIKAALKVSFEI